MVTEFTGYERINEVIIMRIGPDYILFNLSFEFNDKIHTQQIESVTALINSNIKQSFLKVKRVIIEAESWKFTH